MRFLSIIIGIVFFVPSVVQAGMQETRQYLQNKKNDAWVVMAQSGTGDLVSASSIDRSSVFAFSKSILGFVAAGGDPRTGSYGDLVRDFIDAHVTAGQIGNPEYINDDFWGIMALRSAGVTASDPAIRDARAFVEKAQRSSGGWSWSPTYPVADTDDTAAAIMALLESGVSGTDPEIQRALTYLRSAQNTDGGFPNVPPGPSSVESTAWVVSALWKSGENPNTWMHGNKDAMAYLRTQEKSDGSYGSPGTTAFVAIALASKSYPVRLVTVTPLLIQKEVSRPVQPIVQQQPLVVIKKQVQQPKKKVVQKKIVPAKKKAVPAKKVVKKPVKKVKRPKKIVIPHKDAGSRK